MFNQNCLLLFYTQSSLSLCFAFFINGDAPLFLCRSLQKPLSANPIPFDYSRDSLHWIVLLSPTLSSVPPLLGHSHNMYYHFCNLKMIKTNTETDTEQKTSSLSKYCTIFYSKTSQNSGYSHNSNGVDILLIDFTWIRLVVPLLLCISFYLIALQWTTCCLILWSVLSPHFTWSMTEHLT